jgi:putative ABC transport system permease protein
LRLQDLPRELGLAYRRVRADRGLTITALLTLALGIGANTAFFSAIRAVFLRPLSYPHADRLAHIWAHWPGGFGNLPYPDYVAMTERTHSFEEVAACESWGTVALTGGDRPLQLRTFLGTANYLTLMGARPLFGRLFRADDTAVEGEGSVAILTFPLWQRRFGGAPGVIGQTILLNRLPFVVVGVLPQDFHTLGEVEEPPPDVWLPISMAPRLLGQPSLRDQSYSIYWALGLLKPGVSFEEATADLAALSGALAKEHPDTHRGHGLLLQPARQYVTAPFRKPVLLLFAGSALILLIGCVNVANLLLATLATRSREMALRVAIGASTGDLVRQLLWESALLAGAGGAAGALVAIGAIHALAPLVQTTVSPLLEVRADPLVLAGSLVLTTGTALLVGLVPALELRRLSPGVVLAKGGRGSSSSRKGLRRVLVAGEMTLAVCLLVGATLMLRSLRELEGSGLGFPTDRLLTFRLGLRGDRYGLPGARERFSSALVQRMRALPGVESASLWGPAMLGHATWVMSVFPSDRDAQGPEDFVQVFRHSVSPGALADLGIPLRRGREFTSFDATGSPAVAIASESVVRQLYGSQDPLGRQLQRPDPSLPHLTIVGIAADVRHRQRYALEDLAADLPLGGLGPQRDVYLPYLQRPNPDVTVAVRADPRPDLVALVEGAVRAIDADLPVSDVRSLEDRLGEQNEAPRALTLLLGAYAGVAVVLAALGVYGVLSQSVGQMTRSIGIRVALGAEERHILGLVVSEGLVLACAGALLGLLIACGIARLMQNLLYGVSTHDLLSFCAPIPVLGAAALAGCLSPARRALRLGESAALRSLWS